MSNTRRVREPRATRAAVLDSAEEMFARFGYGDTTLKGIGEAAGVSRGAPAYLFGSKSDLYVAVKKRLSENVREFAARSRGATSDIESGSPQEVLMAAMGLYMDFLAANPNYVRFVEREASGEEREFLAGVDAPEARLAQSLGSFGVEFLEAELNRGKFRKVDARQLSASMIALCSFPYLLGGGLIRTLGIDPNESGFLEERKQHVTELLLNGIQTQQGR